MGSFNLRNLLIPKKPQSVAGLNAKAIQNIFTPALTAYLSEQVWGRGMNTAPIYPDWTTTSAASAYVNIDQVYAVVNKIAETTSLIPMYVYYQKDEKKAARLKSLTSRLFYTSKGIMDIMIQQMKALADAGDNDPLVKLLEAPNEFQSEQEFNLACYCYYLINGEVFIYKYRAEAGANQGRVKKLYILPPSNVIVHVTKDYPQTITSYEYVIGGHTVYKTIPPENIIHVKKFNPECGYGYDFVNKYSQFRGLSPLIPAQKLITRIKAGDDASVAQLQNGGLPGIVYEDYPGAEELSIEALGEQKNAFYSYLHKSDNKGMPFFSANKKGYIQMGLKLADMELTELQHIDFERLCNIYKVSTILFNSNNNNTYNNYETAVKEMYTSVCLPMAYTFRDKFNAELASEDWNDKRERFIDVDVSSITELQEDYKEMAEVLATLPITPTGNEMRQLFKWDAIEHENMNLPLVKQGYSLIDELSFSLPNPE